jgi:hypothetical protein
VKILKGLIGYGWKAPGFSQGIVNVSQYRPHLAPSRGGKLFDRLKLWPRAGRGFHKRDSDCACVTAGAKFIIDTIIY